MDIVNCPKCNSANWKLCPVIYAEGLTSVDTETVGSALGVGVASGGLGVGYARGTAATSGSHQTSLSKTAAPPEVPPHPGDKLSKAQQNGALLLFQLVFSLIFVIWAFKEAGFVLGLAALAFVWFLMKRFWRGNTEGNREYGEYELRYGKQLNAYMQGKEAYERWELTGICLRCGNRFETPASPTGAAAAGNVGRLLSAAGTREPAEEVENSPVFACPKCGVGNRVSKQRGRQPTCGKCGSLLFIQNGAQS